MVHIKLQISPELYYTSYANVSNIINGLKARKMNITTRLRYYVETAFYTFVMYNGSGNTCYDYRIDLPNVMVEISNFDFDVRESSDKDFVPNGLI